MLRRILLASAGAMALTGVAFAADLPGPPPLVYLPPPPVFSWTGVYIGGQIGYAWGTDNGTLFDSCSGPFCFLGPFSSAASTSSSPNGAIGGAHIGYNWQLSQWVLGVEADVDATNLQGHTHLADSFFFAPPPTGPGPGRADIRSTIQGSFRGRVGWAWDRVLFYGTGGVAFTDTTDDYRSPGGFSLFESRTRSHVGWTAGGGIEYALTNNWIFGAEYRYTDFGKFTDSALFGLDGSGFLSLNLAESRHLTENRVQGRVSYKFDWFNPSPVVAKY